MIAYAKNTAPYRLIIATMITEDNTLYNLLELLNKASVFIIHGKPDAYKARQ